MPERRNTEQQRHAVANFRDRDRWMRDVLHDVTLTNAAKVVATRIALFLHVGNGRCDPAYETLGREVGAHRTSVIRAVRDLVTAGWLTIERSRGFHTNHFVLKWAAETVAPMLPFEAENSSAGATVPAAKRSHRRTENSSAGAPQTVAPTLPKQRKENNVKRTAKVRESIRQQGRLGDDASFDRFWAIYPRHVAKAAGRRAFAAALKRASADAIIDGARRYASERSGQDEKYTAHAATWLHADRWLDEPAAVNGAPVIDERGNPIEQPQRRQSGLKPSALSMMFPGRRQ